MSRRFRIVDVFTETPLTGNQLAVVLDADGLDDATLQRIAREFNFSETTFLLPSNRSGCDFRIRIFTPGYELPVAGHPTVGTAHVLHAEGLIRFEATLELRVGPTPVEVDAEGRVWMTQPECSFGPQQPDNAGLAAALGVDVADLRADLPAEVASIGNAFLMVPLVSIEAVSRARVVPDRWAPVDAVSSLRAAYVFAVEGGRARARLLDMSLPSEDPATGSAAGPLGAYVARHLGIDRLVVEQGVEIGRRSVIEVDASGPRPRVGGHSVVVAAGQLEVP